MSHPLKSSVSEPGVGGGQQPWPSVAELQAGPRVILLGQNLEVRKPDDRYGKGGGPPPEEFPCSVHHHVQGQKLQ